MTLLYGLLASIAATRFCLLLVPKRMDKPGSRSCEPLRCLSGIR
jgi:hypothetical protein